MALDKLTKVQSVGISSFIQVVGVVTATQGFDGNITGIITATSDLTFGANSRAKLFENGTQSGVQATNSGSSAHLMTHDGNEDIHVDPSGYIKVEVAGSERLRITSTGRQQSHAGYAGVGINTFASWARTGGAIRAEVGYNAVTTDYMYFGTGTNHPLALRVNNDTALYIKNDAGKSVGIGTDNPTAPLAVMSSSDPEIRFGYNETQDHRIAWDSSKVFLEADPDNANGSSALGFKVDGTERLRITSGGQVNIGGNYTQTTWLTHIEGAYNKAGLRVVSGAPGYSDPFVVATSTGGERFRITGDGKMGVGTASPNHKLTLHNSGTGTFDALNITSGLTNSVGLQLGINSGSNAFFWHTANGAIQFATNNVERMRVTNNGITFNGDTAAANALDDYEEGTWTPQLLGGTSNPSLTYSAQSGGYEKIGSLVHLSFFMHVSAVNSQGSGYLELHGLPYIPVTSPLGASEVPALVLQTQPFADGKAANRFAFCRTVGGSSRMFVGYRDLTSNNAIIPTNAAANISTGYFIGHITYRSS
jgi:hypothetical protein